MGEVCNYCGRENRTGTLFCKSCGRRIDYSQRKTGAMSAPGAKPPPQRKSTFFRSFFRCFFTLAVFSGLLCAGGYFYLRIADESVFPVMRSSSEEDVRHAAALTESIRNYRRAPQAERFAVPDTVLNIILNRHMLPTLPAARPDVTRMAVRTGEKDLTVWISAKFFGFIHTVVRFRGTLKLERRNDARTVLKFAAEEADVGTVRFPEPQKLASLLKRLTDNPFLETLLASAERIETADGKLIVVMQTGTERRAEKKDAGGLCGECGLKLVNGICPKLCPKCRQRHVIRGKCPSCSAESDKQPLMEQYAAFLKRLDWWEDSPSNKTHSVVNELEASVPEDNAVIRENLAAYLSYSLFAENVSAAFDMPYAKNFIMKEHPACETCGGSGRVRKEVPVNCPKCHGTGTYREEKIKRSAAGCSTARPARIRTALYALKRRMKRSCANMKRR